MNSDPARAPGQESAPSAPTPPTTPPSATPRRRRRRWYLRLLRGCLSVVAVLAIGALVISGALIAMLARGPVDLNFITPQLQAALDAQVPQTDLRLGGTVLAWDGDRRTVEIRASDVTISDPGGEVLASFPAMSVQLSIVGMLHGTLAPQSIDVDGANVRLVAASPHTATQRPAAPVPTDQPLVSEFDVKQLAAFASELLSPLPDGVAPGAVSGVAQYLTEVRLRNASVQFDAPTGGWVADGLNITMSRLPRSTRIDASGRFSAAGVSAPLTFSANRDLSGAISAALDLSATPPGLAVGIARSLPAFANLVLPADLPNVTGRVTVDLDPDFAWTTVAIDVVAPITASAALAPRVIDGTIQGADATLAIRGLDLVALGDELAILTPFARFDGTIDGEAHATLDADWMPIAVSANIIGSAGQVNLPELYLDGPLAIAGFDAAISAIGFDGTLPASVLLEPLNLDLGNGATAMVTLNATRDEDGVAYTADATAAGVLVDDLARLWPRGVGHNARDWVIGNLEDGGAERATLTATATAPADDIFAVTDIELTGQIDFDGITTHYLRPMPPVRDTSGIARFTTAEFVIDITGGRHDGLVVEAAQIRITGLGTGDEIADIDLTISGPADAALVLLDTEPLGYASELGLDPAGVSGAQVTNLALQVPLRKSVRLDDIQVAAASSLSGMTIADGPFDRAIENGELSLEVDTNGLIAWGDISLGGINLTGTWTENFVGDSAVATQYEVSGFLTARQLAGLGLDFTDSLSGDLGVGVTYAILTDGTAVGAADIDLAGASIDMPGIGLTKPMGMPATAEVQFVVEDGDLSDVPEFRLFADDIVANGAIHFSPPGSVGSQQISQITLSRLAYGANDLSAVIDFPIDSAAPLDVRISGPRLDIRPFISFDSRDDASGAPQSLAPQSLATISESDDPADQPFRLTIRREDPVAQVIVTDGLAIEGLWGQLRHDGDRVRAAVLQASLPQLPAPVAPASGDGAAPAVEAAAPAAVDILIEDAGTSRRFDISAGDMGILLAALGLTGAVRDGFIRADGVIDDTAGTITGRVVGTDFRMVDAPLLGRILTFPSLIGIANTLSGRGIAFSRGVFPFVLTDTDLTIDDGRVRGSQLGILVNGTFDRVDDTLDIRGEIAPATLINSMLNNIPIVGQVLTGGGEGVFAATYRINGPFADPTVSVNPISVFAPGFIRNIIGGFSDQKLAVEEPDPYPDPDSGVQ